MGTHTVFVKGNRGNISFDCPFVIVDDRDEAIEIAQREIENPFVE